MTDTKTPGEPESRRFIRIDPRNFITPPLSSCPKCGRETFGVLSVFPRHYVRRCRECWHTTRIDLPQLAFQPQPGRCRGGLARVVRLHSASGDDGVATLDPRVGQ